MKFPSNIKKKFWKVAISDFSSVSNNPQPQFDQMRSTYITVSPLKSILMNIF